MFITKVRKFALIVILNAAAMVPMASAQQNPSADAIIDHALTQEHQLMRSLKTYSPLVETYIQNLTPDRDLGSTPIGDKYFLGKLHSTIGMTRDSFVSGPGFLKGIRDTMGMFVNVKYLPDGFAQMMLIDDRHFDRTHYDFEFVRREFLGEVRCLVFDVKPKAKSDPGSFLGRIWVEDRDNNIVRFNGTYAKAGGLKVFFHFDSWREEMQPGLWLPAYVYSEESDLGYVGNLRKLQFKAQTRIFGYNVGHSGTQSELTSLNVESDTVKDNVETSERMSPIGGLRAWERQAEDNVVDKMEKSGILARSGDVDKVLATVVNNLEATNELSIDPEIRCRVLLTSPLESFTVGHTIIISRGLIDVLPDEASLAMVVAHELGHIALGHRLDTRYAFNDRLLFDDYETFSNVWLKRDESEEKAADEKAIAFLKNSPYKDKLASAGLFLSALSDRSKQLPSLLHSNIGNQLAKNGEVIRMTELMQGAPKLERAKKDQIAALPLGGRIHVNPWDNSVDLIKNAPVTLVHAGEKMQFEISPIYLYLTRRKTETAITSSVPTAEISQ